MANIDYLNLRETVDQLGRTGCRLGKDFCICEITYRPQLKYPFRINEYCCIICTNGVAEGYIDLLPYTLKKSHLSINMPQQLLEQKYMSKDFKAIAILMNSEFMQELGFPYNFHLDKMLRDKPVIELRQSELQSLLSYCNMATKLLEVERPYQKETLRHLTCAFFYGIGSYLYSYFKNAHPTNDEILMQKFLNTVRDNFRMERKVSFYAYNLNVSASYLSTVIKKVSGRTPSEWIDNYVVKEVCALLKGTNLTIQEISQELGFSNQSFFGKFFKRIMGISPKEYREYQCNP